MKFGTMVGFQSVQLTMTLTQSEGHRVDVKHLKPDFFSGTACVGWSFVQFNLEYELKDTCHFDLE